MTFTATVTTTDGVAATGTVSFSDGSTVLSTVALGGAPGAATYATAAMAGGSHSITAIYGGDATEYWNDIQAY